MPPAKVAQRIKPELRLARVLWKQRCRLNSCSGMQGDVSGIQMRLCVAGAAPLYCGPLRCAGGAAGPCPLPGQERLTAGPASAAARQHPGNRGGHMGLALQPRSLVSHFGRHPAPCAQPIPARSLPGLRRRTEQRSHLGAPGRRSAFVLWLGSSPEDVPFDSAASFPFFFFFLK